LLVHAHVARAVLEGDAPTRGEAHLDDLHRLWHARRRDVAPKIAGGGISPLELVVASRQRAAAGFAAPVGASNSEARVTPKPPASFSRTTAVGLLSPRSMSEIIDRLTPLLVARASSESARAERSSRTRSPIRRLRSEPPSPMLEASSTILESASSRARSHLGGG
jgi:hypothetical protein